ncbi:MAG: hypothetical protein AB8G86_26940 [Saprospiraceae bacterium]
MKNLIGFFSGLLLLASCGEEIDCCVLPVNQTFKFDTKANGCANFYVYKEDLVNNLHLFVNGDRTKLDLDLTEKEFGVTANSLQVQILQFENEIGNYACDDVANDQGEIIDTWKAISGQVMIQITEDSISVTPWEMTYKMTVKLKNIQLENTQKELANLPEVFFEEVYVGWLPG